MKKNPRLYECVKMLRIGKDGCRWPKLIQENSRTMLASLYRGNILPERKAPPGSPNSDLYDGASTFFGDEV